MFLKFIMVLLKECRTRFLDSSFAPCSSRSSASRSSRRELIAAAAASPIRKIAGEPIFVSDGQTIRSDPLYTLSLRKSGRKESLSLIQVETV